MSNKVEEAQDLRTRIGRCSNCGSDMVGMVHIGVGFWRAFCTDCEHSVEAADHQLVLKWRETLLPGDTTCVAPPAVQHDAVDHPKHYTSHPSGVECIRITEHMGFNLGNALKYIWRCDLKKDAIEDLKKARFYIEREIALRERDGS